MKENNFKITIEKGDGMQEFLIKLKEIKNPEIRKQLEILFSTDETKAWFEYRKYIAIEIMKEDKNFFERLSDL